MEADSTTPEQDSDSTIYSSLDRESLFLQKISMNYCFLREVVLPLLNPSSFFDLISWMKQIGLLPSTATCPSNREGCSMRWKASDAKKELVDTFQWQCIACRKKVKIRDNSFFKSMFCPLSKALVLILAWCQDVEFENAAIIFGVKNTVVWNLYEKIERVLSMRPMKKLGGPGSVLLVELYPDFVEELYPVSSKSELSNTQQRILCIADTKKVPTQYWLQVINSALIIPTENNNTQIKKMNICEEVLTILDTATNPGGLCAIGGGKLLTRVCEDLKNKKSYEGITSMSNLTAQANSEMQSFLSKCLWKPVIGLCEAAQEIPKHKIQQYLSSALWRWENEAGDPFATLIHLLADHDFTKPIIYYKKKKDYIDFDD